MRRERRVEATRPVTTMCGAIKELLLLFHVFSNSIGLKKKHVASIYAFFLSCVLKGFLKLIGDLMVK